MAVLEADDQELTACQSIEANRLAKQLKGLCPPHETLDQAMFAAGLTALFCEYPYEIVETVCHPARGLPRTQKFGLKIADVEEALSNEVRRRANIVAAARYVVDTAARIAAERAPEPKYISVERRQELVKQLRARAM